MRVCGCGALVTNERHKRSLLRLNARRPILAWRSTAVRMGSALACSAGGGLLSNADCLAWDDRLLHFGAVLTGRVKPAPVTKNDKERVERAAATTGGLTQKVPYSTVVDRARRFGNHGTSFRSSTAGTWSMGWVRLRGSVATPPSGGRSEVFQSS
jgi:hypothetical protein